MAHDSINMTAGPAVYPARSVASRECAVCTFTGTDDEFIAFGHYPDGTTVLTHRDVAPEGFVLICCGCAATVGRLTPAVVAEAVVSLVARAEAC